MVVDTDLENKDYGNNRPARPKQAHCISGVTFIVIDNNLVHKLEIDEDTWFQQELQEDGILLRKRTIALDQKS